MIRRQRPGAVGRYQLMVQHRAHLVEVQGFNLLNLMGGAEPVKEVNEGNAGSQGRGLGDECEIHHLLDVVGAEHGPAG